MQNVNFITSYAKIVKNNICIIISFTTLLQVHNQIPTICFTISQNECIRDLEWESLRKEYGQLTKDGKRLARWRHLVCDHQHEDRDGDQDSDLERYLLPRVAGQGEGEHGHEGQHDTRCDQAHHVEERLPRQYNVQTHNQVLLPRAAWVHQRATGC